MGKGNEKKIFRAPSAPPYVWPVAVDPWQVSWPRGQGGGGGGGGESRTTTEETPPPPWYGPFKSTSRYPPPSPLPPCGPLSCTPRAPIPAILRDLADKKFVGHVVIALWVDRGPFLRRRVRALLRQGQSCGAHCGAGGRRDEGHPGVGVLHNERLALQLHPAMERSNGCIGLRDKGGHATGRYKLGEQTGVHKSRRPSFTALNTQFR